MKNTDFSQLPCLHCTDIRRIRFRQTWRRLLEQPAVHAINDVVDIFDRTSAHKCTVYEQH